jgi:ribosome biogenesis GTPase
MNLEDLGFHSIKSEIGNHPDIADFELGRVIAEHKERYLVRTSKVKWKPKLLAICVIRPTVVKIFRQWETG